MAAWRQNCFTSLMSRGAGGSLVHRNFPPLRSANTAAWPACLSIRRGRPLGHAWQIVRHKKSLSGERRVASVFLHP
jgi:hypothetical protein